VNDPDVVTYDLVGCARCLGDGHDGLEFRRLTHPIILNGGIEATRWATCPTTGEPILWATVKVETRPT
jgi:hypothetical protein